MFDLVAFDLDGTVLDSQGRLTDSSAEAVAELMGSGVAAAIISGRGIGRTLQPFEGRVENLAGLYLGAHNGAVVVGPDAGSGRPVFHEERLDAESLAIVARYTQEAGLNLVCADFDQSSGEIAEVYHHALPVSGMASFGGPGFALDPDLYAKCQAGDRTPPPLILVVVDPDERPGHIAGLEAAGGDRITVSWAIPDRIQVIRRGVDKGRALRMLAERMGVPLERVLAIGDGHNDLPMLRAAGAAVLMGNADQSVRDAIEGEGIRIGPPLSEGGFAATVRKYALAG